MRNAAPFSFGGPSYLLAPGDYNGDGVTDAAVYLPSSSGMWFVYAQGSVQYGDVGDIAVAAD